MCWWTELIRWKSFDERELSGFLYPAAKKFTGKRPVVINIHGGPEGQARPGFEGRYNYLMNELGVAMIYPNVQICPSRPINQLSALSRQHSAS